MVWSSFPTLLGAPSGRVQWDPWREMGRLQDELTRLLTVGQRPEVGAAAGPSNFPPVRIVTDAEGAHLTALVPGLSADDFEVVIERDLVKLEGSRPTPEPAEGEVWTRQERRLGPFSRSFRLTFEVDAEGARAQVQDGVLEVFLPRSPEQRPRKIEVRAS
jgi:HSP20 family protein